MYNMNVIIWT